MLQSLSDIQSLCRKYRARYKEYDAGYNDWGYPQLHQAYHFDTETSTFIMNIGDDDVMVKGAVPRIVEIIQKGGAIPYLFQAILHPSEHRGNTEAVLLWNDSDRSIVRQKITGQNFIVPTDHGRPNRLAYMTDDFAFIDQTIKNWNGLVKWVPVPIVSCY
jgi:hypothetical protein